MLRWVQSQFANCLIFAVFLNRCFSFPEMRISTSFNHFSKSLTAGQILRWVETGSRHAVHTPTHDLFRFCLTTDQCIQAMMLHGLNAIFCETSDVCRMFRKPRKSFQNLIPLVISFTLNHGFFLRG